MDWTPFKTPFFRKEKRGVKSNRELSEVVKHLWKNGRAGFEDFREEKIT